METPCLVVGAASRAPPPTPRFRRRRLPRPRGGAHCFPFARAARPALLTRCSYSSYSSRCVQIPIQHHSVLPCSHNCCARARNCTLYARLFLSPIRVSGRGTAILAVSPAARAPVPFGGFPLYLEFVSARIGSNQRMMFLYVGYWEFCRLYVEADSDQAWMTSPQIIPLIFCCPACLV